LLSDAEESSGDGSPSRVYSDGGEFIDERTKFTGFVRSTQVRIRFTVWHWLRPIQARIRIGYELYEETTKADVRPRHAELVAGMADVTASVKLIYSRDSVCFTASVKLIQP
jgi:hypothetical protein